MRGGILRFYSSTLTLTLGLGILRRPTDYIHVAVSRQREREPNF
jgi:hypothetical protein